MNNADNTQVTQQGSGKALPVKDGVESTLLDFFKRSLEMKCVDAFLLPMKTPESGAYAWVLMNDISLLESARPLPPVMTVQGGHVLSEIAKHGRADHKIAAFLRPCEIRAAVELSKLKQIDLEHIVLISVDCPGAVPLTEYMTEPKKYEDIFQDIFSTWENSESLRPVCRICQRFSHPSEFPEGSDEAAGEDPVSSDLHIGLLGGAGSTIFLVPTTDKGREFLGQMDFELEDSLDTWRSEVTKRSQDRLKKRQDFNLQWHKDVEGSDKFSALFDECINCHNCMRVCPICYCQQCYFDSQFLHVNSEEYMDRAEKRGALRFPLDTIQFHLGRMSHMVLSCVSCGACEDACPMNIPVAQAFSMVGDETQKDFVYTPGRSREDPLPLQSFVKEEFCEVEMPSECSEKLRGEAE